MKPATWPVQKLLQPENCIAVFYSQPPGIVIDLVSFPFPFLPPSLSLFLSPYLPLTPSLFHFGLFWLDYLTFTTFLNLLVVMCWYVMLYRKVKEFLVNSPKVSQILRNGSVYLIVSASSIFAQWSEEEKHQEESVWILYYLCGICLKRSQWFEKP